MRHNAFMTYDVIMSKQRGVFPPKMARRFRQKGTIGMFLNNYSRVFPHFTPIGRDIFDSVNCTAILRLVLSTIQILLSRNKPHSEKSALL